MRDAWETYELQTRCECGQMRRGIVCLYFTRAAVWSHLRRCCLLCVCDSGVTRARYPTDLHPGDTNSGQSRGETNMSCREYSVRQCFSRGFSGFSGMFLSPPSRGFPTTSEKEKKRSLPDFGVMQRLSTVPDLRSSLLAGLFCDLKQAHSLEKVLRTPGKPEHRNTGVQPAVRVGECAQDLVPVTFHLLSLGGTDPAMYSSHPRVVVASRGLQASHASLSALRSGSRAPTQLIPTP